MNFQLLFQRKILIIIGWLALVQFLFLLIYVRYSNLNQYSEQKENIKLYSDIQSKLSYFRQIILTMEPQNEAVLRSIHGDILSLIYYISSKLDQSPQEVYKQLSLNDSSVESYFKGKPPVIGVLVVACNRSEVKRTLSQIIKLRLSKKQWPLVVSQGCESEIAKSVILEHINEIDFFVKNIPKVNTDNVKIQFRGYYRIAAHFKMALDFAFNKIPEADALIVVEDDLDIAPDFFEYFAATYRVLKEDSTLLCVSGFNDNGRPNLIDKSAYSTLYRTDFFPGLGWMLLRSTWRELRINWPKRFWDDHMRSFLVRRNRACIRPEIPRTLTFGRVGVSNGLFFKKYLETIELNKKFINFSSQNLSYLHIDNFNSKWDTDIANATLIPLQELMSHPERFDKKSVKVHHRTEEFKTIADFFGLMSDLRDDITRTSYYGVVTFFWNNIRVFLVRSYD